MYKYIYSPYSYFELAKIDFSQLSVQEQESQILNGNRFVIGGLYELINENERDYIFNPNSLICRKELLNKCFVEYKSEYNFRAGEYVFLCPSTLDASQYLLLPFMHLDVTHSMKISRIINSFFAVLELDNGLESFPIKFSDIRRNIL